MFLGPLLDLSGDKEVDHLHEVLKVGPFAFLGLLLNLSKEGRSAIHVMS